MLDAVAVDPDLHAFVDGCLDSQRRVDVLKRVARSPDDRAKLALWQDQNDSLRSAFAGIEDEAVPQSLDLAAPNRSSGLSFDGATLGSAQPHDPALRPNLLVSGLVAGLVLCAGILMTFLIAREGSPRTEPVDLLTTSGVSGDADDQASLDASGSRRAADRGAAEIARGDVNGTRVSLGRFSALPMPLTIIPDLSRHGLQFLGATREVSGSLLLRYAAASGERVVVAAVPAAPAREAVADDALAWQAGGTAFAIAGTLPPADLRSIAATTRAQIAGPTLGHAAR